jgi:homoserine dehydrogenase
LIRFDLILVGFGNVGRRFARLLSELKPILTREYEIDTRIVGIATRGHGQIFRASGVDAVTLAERAESGEAVGPGVESTIAFLRRTIASCAPAARDRRLIVVETTTLDVTSGQPAIRHVAAALRLGAHAITSNKGPAAFAHRTLGATARRRDRCFLFESAVMDGVPIFNLVKAALPGVVVNGFRGVVNSTTQYMLTAMEQGETFDQALKAMQRAGIAEADPTLDVDGWDAAAKTAVLANVLLDGALTPRTVDREGLTRDTEERTRAARVVGRRLKLIASGERTSQGVRGNVRLMELPETDLLGGLESQQNALVLRTDMLGEIAIVQRGSGLTQTAYGLVSDLVAVSREIRRTSATQRRSPRAPRRRSRARRIRRRS